jgi:hypothetical protein
MAGNVKETTNGAFGRCTDQNRFFRSHPSINRVPTLIGFKTVTRLLNKDGAALPLPLLQAVQQRHADCVPVEWEIAHPLKLSEAGTLHSISPRYATVTATEQHIKNENRFRFSSRHGYEGLTNESRLCVQR